MWATSRLHASTLPNYVRSSTKSWKVGRHAVMASVRCAKNYFRSVSTKSLDRRLWTCLNAGFFCCAFATKSRWQTARTWRYIKVRWLSQCGSSCKRSTDKTRWSKKSKIWRTSAPRIWTECLTCATRRSSQSRLDTGSRTRSRRRSEPTRLNSSITKPSTYKNSSTPSWPNSDSNQLYIFQGTHKTLKSY